MDAAARGRLRDWLAGALAAPDLAITDLRPLHGGAIQENWLLDLTVAGAAQALVLRKDAAATISLSRSRAEEFALLSLAHGAGVAVPKPVAFCADASVLGTPFAVMARVDGTGLGPKIVKDMALGGAREALAMRLGRELATIHGLQPDDAAAAFLGNKPEQPGLAVVQRCRDSLDALGLTRPVLEWALRWAQLHVPRGRPVTLCHRDFRTGNYMVDARGLTAILDWEFAGWSDPMEDIGWFCARCWRFSRPELEAGGIGTRKAFYEGYRAGGGSIDADAVAWWEVVAHLRWAVTALEQADRHISGREHSLEHVMTGRIAAELEYAALMQTGPAAWLVAAEPAIPAGLGPRQPRSGDVTGPALLALARAQDASTLAKAAPERERYFNALTSNAEAVGARDMANGALLEAAREQLNQTLDGHDIVMAVRSGAIDGDATVHADLVMEGWLAASSWRPGAVES